MKKEDYFKYYIQGTDHYLIPKDVFNELFNEMSNWREEAKELKKQVEEYKEQVNKGLYNTCLPYTTGYNKAIKDKETQQKEFIDYMENKICIANKVLDEQEEDEEVRGYVLARKFMLEEILSKYQEIIGKDINVTIKGDKDDK